MTELNDNYLQEMKNLYLQTLRTGKGGSAGILCPHSFDSLQKKNDCRLCDLCRGILIDRNTPKNDPLKEKARNINAKRKYYSNVIFMSNPSEVVVLEYGEKIFNKLIAGQMDELSEWKNFMHPVQGRNLYVTKVKIGPEKKDVDYNVEPRMSISSLPDPSVLARLYDMENITALIEAGKVKPVYQSKFDFQKTEVRFLPSGDKTRPLMFFKLVLWHYNVSKEEFEAIQRGEYNPITGIYTQSAKGIDIETTATYKDRSKASSVKKLSPDDILAEWGGIPSDLENDIFTENANKSDDNFETETDVEPMCFGSFDPDNPTCVGKCAESGGWGDACIKITKEKQILRNKAKRLSK